jgi:NADH-quinone oxidoreductase subunit G
MQAEVCFISINGKKIECKAGQTILEVACQMGIEIPHFCYHPGVRTQGNCHVCFVSVKGIPDLVTSCSFLVKENIEISTESLSIEEARKEVLRLLIADHPIECPVCARAGECDLQDLTFLYGEGGGPHPMPQSKKKIPLQNFSPMIQGNMERCIGCHRCVSFLEDVTGTAELGIFQDAAGFMIDTCTDEGIVSELSGNLLDLCPSGALVESSSIFYTRPWETKKVNSIDIMDAMGSSIRLDCREEKVLRVLPVINPNINQYWSTDKARFSCDGLLHQRLDQPYIRKNGTLEPASWINAFKTLVRKISELHPSEMAFLVGDLVEVDSVYLLRQLLDDMKVYNRDCRIEGAFFSTEERGDYLFNTTLEKVENSDACLIIGADIRYDAPLLNLRLRNCYKNSPTKIAIIGHPQDLTFDYLHLGISPHVLNAIAEGIHPFSEVLQKAVNPILILGVDALSSGEGEDIYKAARFIAEKYNMVRADWNGFNVLHRAAGRVGALDVGFLPGEGGQNVSGILRMARSRQLKLLYLMGVDELPLPKMEDVFVVYQGHHGDAGAESADLILPGAAFPEKNGFYVNTEGRVQFARQAVFPPSQAKEDWKIIRGLSEVLGYKLPYETYEDVYQDLKNYSLPYQGLGTITPAQVSRGTDAYKPIKQGEFVKDRQNYYFTNPICRASPAMGQRVGQKRIIKRASGIEC